jgi:hypothetical protein
VDRLSTEESAKVAAVSAPISLELAGYGTDSSSSSPVISQGGYSGNLKGGEQDAGEEGHSNRGSFDQQIHC